MAEYLIQDTTLTKLAAPIKTLKGSSSAMTISAMQSAVEGANTELETQEDLLIEIIDKLSGKLMPGAAATATASDIVSGKTAYVNGNKITGTLATKSSSNLTVSGATVTAPAGVYTSAASKSVSTVTQATPTISVSGGTVTASLTQSAGYVSAGTKSATQQLTTKAAATITPSTSSQTAVAANTYCTGAITVGAIPSDYLVPTATKAATTYTPTTSNQTIAAGTYCSGAQTISGDSNLVAGNIKTGVSIFGVTGTYAGPSGYVVPTATQAAKTWTPGTSNQTIAAGTYCSGAQTISGDSNLVAGNIKSGTKIFGVTGTYTPGPSAGTVCAGKEQTWTLVNGYTNMGGGSQTVTYGSSVSAASDGSVTINNATTETYSSGNSGNWKGKYVHIGDSNWACGTRCVIFINSSATISSSGGTLTCDKAKPIFVYNAKV